MRKEHAAFPKATDGLVSRSLLPARLLTKAEW